MKRRSPAGARANLSASRDGIMLSFRRLESMEARVSTTKLLLSTLPSGGRGILYVVSTTGDLQIWRPTAASRR